LPTLKIYSSLNMKSEV